MTTARTVPVTTEIDGDELDGADAWRMARKVGVGRLLVAAFVRFRYGDGFTNSRALALQTALAVVPFLLALAGLAADIDQERPARVLASTIQAISPGSGEQDALASAVTGDQSSEEAGELALGFGLAFALLSMTTAMAQVERGLNRIYGIRRDRPALAKYGRAAVMTAILAAPVGHRLPAARRRWRVRRRDGGRLRVERRHRRPVARVRWPVGPGAARLRDRGRARPRPPRRQPALTWLALGSGVAVALTMVATGCSRRTCTSATRSAPSTAHSPGCSHCSSGRCSPRSRSSTAQPCVRSWRRPGRVTPTRRTTIPAARTACKLTTTPPVEVRWSRCEGRQREPRNPVTVRRTRSHESPTAERETRRHPQPGRRGRDRSAGPMQSRSMAISVLPHPSPTGVVAEACALVRAFGEILWAARTRRAGGTVGALEAVRAELAALEARVLAEIDPARSRSENRPGFHRGLVHPRGRLRRGQESAPSTTPANCGNGQATLTALVEGVISPEQTAVVLDAVDALPTSSPIVSGPGGDG